MTTYTDEINVYNPQAIANDIDAAGQTADTYLSTVDSTGLMVHPANDSTTGWKISSAIELLKSGVSYIRMWLEGNPAIAKLRLGLESAGHAIFSPDGMEVFSDSTTSVAKFGTETRIGVENGERFVVDSGSIHAYDENNGQYFSVSANGLSFGSNTAATSEDLQNFISNQFDVSDRYLRTQVANIIDGLCTSEYTTFTQDGDTFTFGFSKLDTALSAIEKYVRIDGDVMTLGASDKPVCAELSSTGLVFYPTISPHPEWATSTAYSVEDKVVHDFYFYECAQAHTSSVNTEPGTESGASYWNPISATRQPDYENPIASLAIEDGEGVLVIHRAVVVNELRFDNWAWMPRGNGNLALKWIGA